jgi:uncharacterized protein
VPKVRGTELLQQERGRVWELLNDPEALASSIPGCHGFERDEQGERRYRTSITVTVGAVTGTYEGTVEYRDVEEPERCTIAVFGKGDKGTIEGQGTIMLAAGDGGTQVGYEGTFKLAGPVAGVGQRLAPGVTRQMIVETLRNLERRDREPVAPPPEAASAKHAAPAAPPPEAAGGPARARAASETPPARAVEPFRPQVPAWATFAAGCVVGAAVALALRRPR